MILINDIEKLAKGYTSGKGIKTSKGYIYAGLNNSMYYRISKDKDGNYIPDQE